MTKFFASLFVAAFSVHAANDHFISTNGDWNVATNWLGNAIPLSQLDTAFIDDHNTVTLPGGVSGVASAVNLGVNSGVAITGGSLFCDSITALTANTTNSVVISGGGTLIARTVSLDGLGTVTIDNGTVLASSPAGTYFNNLAAVQINAGGFTFGATGAYPVTSVTPVLGGGPLTMNGPGALFLEGSNQLGMVTVNTGLLQLGGLGFPGTANGAVVNNGTLLVSSNDTINGAAGVSVNGSVGTGSNGVVVFNGGTLIVTANGAVNGGSGQGGNFLTPDGSGGSAVALNTGGQLVNMGTLTGGYGGSGALSGGGPGGPGVAVPAGMTVTNAGVVTGGNGGDTGSGGDGLQFAGPGNFTNSPTGNVSGGNGNSGFGGLTGGPGGSGVSFADIGIVNSGGTIRGGSGADGAAAGNGISFKAYGTVTNSAGGVISGGGGSSSGFGAGSGGPAISCNTNGTIVNFGTISGGGGASAGSTTGGNGGNAVQMNGGGLVINSALIQGGSGGAGFIGHNGSSGTGVYIRNAAGTVINTGTINNGISLDYFPNQLTVYPGSLISGGANLSTNNATQLILAGSGSARLSQTITGSLTFTGLLVEQDSATWGLDLALNTHGTNYINSGTLQILNGGSLGAGALMDNSVVEFLRTDTSTFTNVISGTGALWDLGTGSVTLTGANTYTGGTILDGNATLNVSGVGASIYSPDATMQLGSTSNGTLVVSGGATVTDSTALLGGQSTSTNSTAIIKDAGTLWNNLGALFVGTYGTSSLIVEGGATVAVQGGLGPITLGQRLQSGGTLQIGNGDLPGVVLATNINSAQGTGTVIFNHTSPGYYFTQDGTSASPDIPIIGASMKVVQNAGVTILPGTNSYSGTTTINGGTLTVNGALTGTGAVTVKGGVLNGTGTVNGAVTLQGGAIAAGSPLGVLTTGSETWASGSSVNWTLATPMGTPGTQWGLLQINGDLTITASNAAPIVISVRALNGGLVTGFNGSNDWSWTFATYSGNLTGFNSNLFVVDTTDFQNEIYAGQFYVSANTPNQLQLNFVANTAPLITAETLVTASARTAILQVGLNTASNSLALALQYGTDTSYGSATASVPMAAMPERTNSTFTLSGLQPNTTYHYRGVVTYAGGSIYGADATFTTTADTSIFGVTGTNDLVVASSTNSPIGQGANNALDKIVGTVYANADITNTGFTVYPSGSRVVTALSLISAPNHPEDDPASFFLAGSNDGTNFTVIASNTVPAFPIRNYIQSISFSNSTAYNSYRLLFPTVVNASTAAAMQVAEVELLPYGDITSPSDNLQITLNGAKFPSGYSVYGLCDRQVQQLTNKFVLTSDTQPCQVYWQPASGPTILKGAEMIGGSDDMSFPGRTPSALTIEGTVDGSNYVTVLTATPTAPTANIQIQQFAALANTNVYNSYRITFGAPQSGTVVQMGEFRLFGIAVQPTLTISASNGLVNVNWAGSGATLQSTIDLSNINWTTVPIAPVITNGLSSVTLTNDSQTMFFRLVH